MSSDLEPLRTNRIKARSEFRFRVYCALKDIIAHMNQGSVSHAKMSVEIPLDTLVCSDYYINNKHVLVQVSCRLNEDKTMRVINYYVNFRKDFVR